MAPDFYSVSAEPVAASADVGCQHAARCPFVRSPGPAGDTARQVAKGLQTCRCCTGSNGVGNNGVSVAPAPSTSSRSAVTRIRMLAKNTGASRKTQQLAAALRALPAVDVSQGTIVYDPLGKRWIAAAVTDDSGDIGLAMRISKGTDARPRRRSGSRPVALRQRNDTGNRRRRRARPDDRYVLGQDRHHHPDHRRGRADHRQPDLLLPEGAVYSGNAPDPLGRRPQQHLRRLRLLRSTRRADQRLRRDPGHR